MASPLSHAVAALSIGAFFYRPGAPRRLWAIGAICSVVPDFDVIGFRFGIRYGDSWGHRGFTHSLVFAALLAGVVMILAFRSALPTQSRFTLVGIFLFGDRQPRSAGCHDGRRSRGRLLRPVRESPLLSSMEADSHLANRHWPVFLRARPCCRPE